MTPEEANFCSDLRMRVLANKEKGLPAKAGISDEEMKKFIALLRGARSSASQASSKKKAAKQVTPVSTDELKKLFS